MNNRVKYFVIDVDGTMTDGGIYYDENGNEFKKFCTKDAAGYFACKLVGIKTIVITGRESRATNRRMQELSIDFLYQGIKNKDDFLQQLFEEKKIAKNEVGYIGDDLNDYSAMKLCGYVACPKDACREIIEMADYVSIYNGGAGAVRDVLEHYLRQIGEWDGAIKEAYKLGT